MLEEFILDKKEGIPFELFGTIHIALVLLLVITWCFMYIYKDKLSAINKKKKRAISLIIATVLFINMAIYYGGLAYYGAYNWKTHLPLHFCFISGYLFMYSIIFNKTELYKKVYFMAFIGPIPAIVLPDLRSSFDSFLFYQQVISHHVFLLSSLFIFYAYKIHITKDDLIKALYLSMKIFAFMYVFNYIFKTNYIMQNSLPEHVVKLFPFTKYINYPIFWLITTGSLMLMVAYVPVWLEKLKYKNSLHLKESLL